MANIFKIPEPIKMELKMSKPRKIIIKRENGKEIKLKPKFDLIRERIENKYGDYLKKKKKKKEKGLAMKKPNNI